MVAIYYIRHYFIKRKRYIEYSLLPVVKGGRNLTDKDNEPGKQNDKANDFVSGQVKVTDAHEKIRTQQDRSQQPV